MRVAMIGTGYVGLVSGACFADFGHVVTCVDKDASKIERLKKGEIPIYEPGLDDLVAQNVNAGRLNFTTEAKDAIAEADAVFIAVGTPSRRGDGHADLSYVYAAAEEIALVGTAQVPALRAAELRLPRRGAQRVLVVEHARARLADEQHPPFSRQRHAHGAQADTWPWTPSGGVDGGAGGEGGGNM